MHEQDPNCIFKDTQRPKPEPVSSLLVESKSVVTEVDEQDCAVVLDPPCLFDDATPVLVHQQPVGIVHATDTKLYLESVDNVCLGDSVSQSKPLGKLEEVFKAFHEQWKKRWCKHDTWPHSHWQNLVDFARQHMPVHPLLPFEISPELVRAEASRKKPTAAVGLDGVSRMDLLEADHNTLQSLCNMFARATSDGSWPTQLTCGKVASLAKVPDARSTNDFRPITVFGLCYRVFSSLHARFLLGAASEWCHVDIHGNRAQHQTVHLWRTLVDQIQVAYDQGGIVSGLTADIEKAFNCLPRWPILAAAVHVGTPMGTVVAWAGALSQMVRRFKVRDSYSDGFHTSTGLAEGCALSCYGMLLLDDLMHRYVEAQQPRLRVLSFVDNWDFVTWDPEVAVRQLDVLLSFAGLADLTVDRRKTFAWSTSPAIRVKLRERGVPVLHSAKDLGAHVAFSKQRTNKTLVQRLEGLQPLWQQLKMSRASYASKVRALRSVAWPRGLFGVASAPLGAAVWLKHRRLAVQALSFDKPGVNPQLLLGMVEAVADPELVGLLATVAEARLVCLPDFWASELFPAASASLCCPPSSAVAVLLERIQAVGINVQPDGHWQDEIGNFHPALTNYTEVCQRLQWNWNRVVAQAVSHRKDFAGLGNADVCTTRRRLQSFPKDQQAMLRLSLSGGLFTQDAHSHWGGNSNTCKWCGELDSLTHRYFECPNTLAIRMECAPDVVSLQHLLPNALKLRGWALHADTHLDWLRLLDSVSHSIPGCRVPLCSDQWNLVFTDGSCLFQSCPAYRVAAWGVVLASPFHANWTFGCQGVLGCGPLPGLVQTSYRAELYALGFILHHAALQGAKVQVFSDCLGVINRFYLLTWGKSKLKVNSASSDLWQWVLNSVEKLGLENIQLHKTPAHRKVASAVTRHEAWLFWNNGAADSVAKSANLNRSTMFWQRWEAHVRSVMAADELHRQTVLLHLRVAMKSVGDDAKQTLDEVAVAVPRQTRDFDMKFDNGNWQGDIPLSFAVEYGKGLSQRLAIWWKTRSQTGTSLRWISFVHLYVDFQLTWGCPGPIKSGNTWLDSLQRPYMEPEKHPFLSRLKWFRRFVKVFLQATKQVVALEICRSAGEIVQSHLNCASVVWDEAAFQRAEHWLTQNCVGPIARGSQGLKALPIATQQDGMAILVGPSRHGATGRDAA